MKAVVMAGGEGSRLRPLTIGRPKPMVPIVNKAVIGHIFDLLKYHGITEVIVTLRYMASAIQDFFDDGSAIGMKITYSVEEQPLGTAGSVKNAARFLGDETFIVISGDSLTDIDLQELVRVHRERGAMASITLTRVPNPLEFGVIMTDEGGRVTQFLEKPSWGEVISDTVNTGIYVLEPQVLDLIPKETQYDFAGELFPRMLADGLPLFGHVPDGYWCDVGNINEYMKANADVLYGKLRLAQSIGTHLGGGIWVGENVEIAPSAQLFGPIYLGEEVKIKGDVRIYGPAVIRDYTVIDNYNRIERSVIWRNNYVGESCELRGAIATSYSHDSHNLVVLGRDADDMALAANQLIASGGGMALAQQGEILAHVAMPIAGMLSDLPAAELARQFRELRDLSSQVADWEPPYRVFKAIEGTCLACNAGPHLTDLGLTDGGSRQIVDPLIACRETPEPTDHNNNPQGA